MPVSVVSPPAELPVTPDQIKQHLRIDHDNEDAFLDQLARTATAHVEADIRQSLIDRTYRQYVDKVPAERKIFLEAWPVRSIAEITGYNAAGEPVAISGHDYSLHGESDPAFLTLVGSLIQSDFPNGLEVDFVSGHGPGGSDVPANISHAVLLLTAHWYEHRSSYVADGSLSVIPPSLSALLKPSRRLKL